MEKTYRLVWLDAVRDEALDSAMCYVDQRFRDTLRLLSREEMWMLAHELAVTIDRARSASARQREARESVDA